MRLWIVRGILAMVVGLVLSVPLATAQTLETAPQHAVFLLTTIMADGQGWRGVDIGTAFFITPEGHALTNSHVVYRAHRDPHTYRLLAIVGDEFYGAQVVCASRLRDDPTQPHPQGVSPGRDVAEIALTPPDVPFTEWGYRVQDQFVTIAHAHTGPLPQFPVLPLGSHGARGQTVHVIGYGHIGALPHQWTATGTIDDEDRLSDGTRIFTIVFGGQTGRPQGGNSGSPVLTDEGRVIGLWTWNSLTRSNLGIAQAIDSLTPACR